MTGRTRRSFDVVIVGAGVQGLSSAFFLAKNSRKKIALIEAESSYGLGSSSRSGSMIMKSRENRPKIELSLYSFSVFEKFRSIFGEELNFRRTGFLSLVSDELAERYASEHRLRLELGVPSQELSRSQIAAMCPQVNLDQIEFGVFCGDDGEVDAEQIMRCYHQGAEALGVECFFGHRVKGFGTAADQITKVVTEDVEFDCDFVVNAAGACAPEVTRLAGLNLPQNNLRRSIFFTRVDRPNRYAGPMVEDASLEWYYRGLPDGRVLIGMGLEPSSTATDGPNMEFLQEIRKATQMRVPSLAGFEVESGHSGIRPLSPDIIPLIGPTRAFSNFIMNTGWGGEGIMHSPGGGAIVADVINGTSNYAYDITAFAPDRFEM